LLGWAHRIRTHGTSFDGYEFRSNFRDFPLDFTAEQSGTVLATHLVTGADFSARSFRALLSSSVTFDLPDQKGEDTMTQKSKPRTKKDQLIRMLSRKSGVDVPTISKRLGWQPHSTRAALSRLRTSGFELTSEKPGNGQSSRYRITGSPKKLT
jgi:hypothetical protein